MANCIYLASGKAKLNVPGFKVFYNDLMESDVDFKCDMLSVDLEDFDVLIATPPCNYYSRANSYKSKETSSYSQATKHLLPDILSKFIATEKPFIVENVRSFPLFKKTGLFDLGLFVYFHGRHTYWTNIPFNPSGIPQEYDFAQYLGKDGRYHEKRLKSYVQGGGERQLSYFILAAVPSTIY